MSRTLIRYAVDGSPQWGVQFGQGIAPLHVDAASTGELLARHWEQIWSVVPAQATCLATACDCSRR